MLLLARGRSADVFGLDADRVLRRYRDDCDVTKEAAVMAYVGELGFPVPRVDVAGGTDLVMERLTGPTMLAALREGAIGVAVGASLLADLHARLHALPARLSDDPAARILHLDLHPGNVVLSSRGVILIDWANTDEGAPDLDIAMTALIMAQVAVDERSPDAPAAAAAVRGFLAVASGEPRRMLDQAVTMRAADLRLSQHETAHLPLAAAMVTECSGR